MRWREARRLRPTAVALAAVLSTTLAAPALAAFPHVVAPGESLSSVAAADGLSVEELATANGLAPDALLVAGSTVMIPEQAAGAVAEAGAEAGTEATGEARAEPGVEASPEAGERSSAGDSDGDSDDLGSAAEVPVAPGATEGAAAEGTAAPPYPTAETVTPEEVGSAASEAGVPPSLAQAVADAESGFNNNLTSSADARGVMQILPATWSWINETLAGSTPLAPASAASNVRGGVLLLSSLLNASGGDPALAAAGYYQGLQSVRSEGELPSTQQYVETVLALQRQYAGE